MTGHNAELKHTRRRPKKPRLYFPVSLARLVIRDLQMVIINVAGIVSPKLEIPGISSLSSVQAQNLNEALG